VLRCDALPERHDSTVRPATAGWQRIFRRARRSLDSRRDGRGEGIRPALASAFS
jgi:hypothetical protein